MRAGFAVISAVLMILMSVCAAAQGDDSGTADSASRAVMEAYALRMDGDADGAREALEAHLQEEPGDKWAHYELARTYFYFMDMKRAGKSIARAIKLDPDVAEFHYLAGQIGMYGGMLRMKNPLKWPLVPLAFSRMVDAYDRAVACDPAWSEARLRIVEASNIPWYMGVGEKKGDRQIESLDEYDPVYAGIAKCRRINTKEREKRVAIYEALAVEHGGNPALNRHLGLECCALGDYEKGLPYISAAIEADPSQADVLLVVGKARGAGRDFDRATAGAEQYLAMDTPAPLRAYACRQLGIISKRREKANEAKTWFDRAHAIDPHVWSTFTPPPRELFMPPGWRIGKK